MKKIYRLTLNASLLVTALGCVDLCAPLTVRAQTDAAQAFQSPPDTARPTTWWHWVSGNVTPEGITADLIAMKQIGLGGAQIFSVNQGPAGPVKYMSPEWRSLVQHAIQEAHTLGLKLSITDCEGWSESGGPWITPELSMQKVVWTETTAQGGQAGPITLARPQDYKGYYKDITVLAYPSVPGNARITNYEAKAGFNSDAGAVASPDPNVPADEAIDPAKIVDLSAKLGTDGTLSWTPPAGSWTILRFGMTSTGTPIHPAMPETEGLECDKLSREAVTANWNGDMAHVISDSGSNVGTTLTTVLMDSWEAGTGNWTPLMKQDFQSRRGYDLTKWLPALTGRVVGSTDQTERFLWDYRRTMSDLVAENHYGLMQSLAHQHGMLLQAEAVGIGLPTVADELQCKSYTDVPMGEFWIGNPGTLTDDKEAASAAHIYGKTYVAAESYTSVPEVAAWTNDPFSIKALGDDAFCTGVNRFSFHRYAMQPYLNRAPGMTMGPWGLNFERTNTWWVPGKAWITYVTRCESLLQKGLFVGDLCYFYGEGTPRAVGSFNFDPASPAGYDYDVCNADVLLHRMTVRDGRIVLPDGMSYRVLVLPNDTNLSPAVAARVRELVQLGATVVGPKPTASPSLTDYPACDNTVKGIGQEVWGDCDGSTITRHAFGKGQVIWGETLENVLAGVGRDFAYKSDAPGAEVKYIHRRDGATDYYFVCNQKYTPIDASCTFRISGEAPEIWSPDTGSIQKAAVYTSGPSTVTVPLHFDSAGSVFVVFRGAKSSSVHLVSAKAVHVAPVPSAPKHTVSIVSASYGVGTAVDVTDAISHWAAAGQPQLTVNNDLDGGGDPDPNVVKNIVVAYTVDGKSYTDKLTEGSQMALSSAPAGTKNLVITRAEYGITGVTVDTTSEVAALVAAGNLDILVNNAINNGVDPDVMIVKRLSVTYTVDGVRHEKSAQENSTLSLLNTSPDVPPIFEAALDAAGKPGINAWDNGTYQASLSSGAAKTVSVDNVPAPVTLQGTWNLTFPGGLGAPSQISLDKLTSWSTSDNNGVKYFSGTATYSTKFSVKTNQIGAGKALYLDLGVVKNLADVTVNGHELGVLWKAPFRLDITNAVVPGDNNLQIKVTNLWPNRLIGDSSLPDNQKITWTTFNPYHPTSELLDSGLLGPVVLRSSVWKPF